VVKFKYRRLINKYYSISNDSKNVPEIRHLRGNLLKGEDRKYKTIESKGG